MGILYADIVVDISTSRLDKSFQYKIPKELEKKITEGVKVIVPFGKTNRPTDGYVLAIGKEPKCDENKIKYIISSPDNYVTAEEKLIKLAAWMRETYGSTFIQSLRTVMPVKENKKCRGKNPALPGSNVIARDIPNLNEEQRKVYRSICAEFSADNPRPCLLRGVTGSGKTSIYIKLIDDVFKKGKQAILLIPEISLTWQTVTRFGDYFGDKVAILNSRMSKGEKSLLLKRVKEGKVRLVIGPRSALFVPFDNLGLIVIDEEHDTSYQSEQTPKYHARETAVKRAQIESANLLLGSATPSMEARYKCDTKEYALFELENRFAHASLPDVIITDMRKELRLGRKTVLGSELIKKIGETLERKEQMMLFINKRGHTGFYTCKSCGYVLKCPHCDLSLTFHSNGLLMCHYCGYTHPMMKICPKCASSYIGGFKFGTQQAEEAIKKMFPDARVIRMDRDTTTGKKDHEKLLKSFASGEADIMIGTQMIVKGHDFPNVTLVGILAADTLLYAGDFRSAENTYQLIVQAAGRAGRGKHQGCAIIQTYNPDHYVISAAAAQDYEAFYEKEIKGRELMSYPPSGYLMSIHGSARDEKKLENAMNHLRKYIEGLNISSAHLLGPTPEKVSKLRDKYKKVIYIKGISFSEIKRIRRHMEKYIEINSGFKETDIQFSLNE